MVNNQGGFDKETGSYTPAAGSQPTSGKYNNAGFSPDQLNGWKGNAFGKLLCTDCSTNHFRPLFCNVKCHFTVIFFLLFSLKPETITVLSYMY